MSERKGFDLGDYVEVKDRIAILFERFPQARIETGYELTREPDDKPKVIARAYVYRKPEDHIPAGQGHSWMYLPGTSSFTKGSEIENAETSAVGRAIGMLGILIDKSIASAQEVQNKQDDGQSVSTTGDETEELLGRIQKTGKVTAGGSDLYKGDWRTEPDGPAIGFKLKLDGEDRDIPQVKVTGAIAESLAIAQPDLLGERITVKGHLYNVKRAGRTAFYRLKIGERPEDFIETSELRIPPLPDPEQDAVDAIPIAEGQEALPL